MKYKALSVMAPGAWENEGGPKDWFAVADENLSIVAYACTEGVAYQGLAWLKGKRVPVDVMRGEVKS